MDILANTYFFVLGTNHSLSKVDIVNILVRQGLEPKIIAASEELLIVETREALNIDLVMAELGSAAKMGEVFFAKQNLEEIPEIIETEEFQKSFLPKGVENIPFGVSVYGAGGKFQKLNETFFESPKIAREIKTKLEEKGIENNYLPVKERELSSVVVDQRGLVTKGFELVLGVGENEIYVGKTLAVQDYEGYSSRDYGRPARDAKSGMIPPKLAKMLVNLTLKDEDKLMLDPFCGSGTMLQEMVMLGYKRLIGSDSSDKSIRDTEINLDWLFSKFGLNRKQYNIELFKQDVQKIASKINFKTVDAIVTEPYLGSPKAKSFHLGLIEKEVAKLGQLYLAAFDEFRKVLRDDGVIVMIFPVFRFKGKFYHIDIMDGIYALGFKKREYLPHKIEGMEKLNLNLTSRGSIVFFRPGQTVSREIFIFERS
jgi:tRNA G10  N-methylase Trm11